MNQLVIRITKLALVSIVVLRLIFVIDFSQFGFRDYFPIEFNECETEDAEKEGMKKLDEFCSDIDFNERCSILLSGIFNYPYVRIPVQAHFREIVPPPPKG
jgi:hypothetical protein